MVRDCNQRVSRRVSPLGVPLAKACMGCSISTREDPPAVAEAPKLARTLTISGGSSNASTDDEALEVTLANGESAILRPQDIKSLLRDVKRMQSSGSRPRSASSGEDLARQHFDRWRAKSAA